MKRKMPALLKVGLFCLIGLVVVFAAYFAYTKSYDFFLSFNVAQIPGLAIQNNPTAITAGMLNIPRDLWVSIPGFEYGRINTAYPLGISYDVPGGGPALAMQTIESLLGVPIDYYAIIAFYAFDQFIDQLGGINITVPTEIAVD